MRKVYFNAISLLIRCAKKDLSEFDQKLLFASVNGLIKTNDKLVHYDCNHDCDALYDCYERGYEDGKNAAVFPKGYTDAVMKRFMEVD